MGAIRGALPHQSTALDQERVRVQGAVALLRRNRNGHDAVPTNASPSHPVSAQREFVGPSRPVPSHPTYLLDSPGVGGVLCRSQ